jgi:hypothetical protein
MECLQKRAGQYQELMDRETSPPPAPREAYSQSASQIRSNAFVPQLNFLCEFGEGWGGVGLALPEFPGDFCDLSIFEGF